MKSKASSADSPRPKELEMGLRTHLENNELVFMNRRGRPFSSEYATGATAPAVGSVEGSLW